MAKEKIDFSELKMISPEGIVCFPHVFEPHAFEGSADKKKNYSLILVFPKETDLKEMKQLAQRAARAKFGDEWKDMFKRGKLSMPFRDGSEYEQYGEPFVEGATFCTFKSTAQPGVVDKNTRDIIDQTEFYAGCIARVSFLAYPFDSMGNKGVTFLLNNVQKRKDGEPIGGGGRSSAKNDFSDGSESEEDEDDVAF